MYLPIFILCVLPSVLAGLLHIYLFNKKAKVNIAKVIIYYIIFFYGVLSALKMILDGSDLTLIECLMDTIPKTYYHYLFPLIFLVLLSPPIFSLILKKINVSSVLPMFQSLMFFTLAMGFVITNKISNGLYVAVLCVSVVGSIGADFFINGVKYCGRNNIRNRVRYAVPVTFFYIVTVILAMPLTLFFNNISEVPIIPSAVIFALLTGAVIQFVIIAGGGIFLLTCRQFELFYTLLFAVTFVGYIQNMFLNGHMLQMDGTKQVWSGMQLYGNIVVWIVIVAAVLCIKKICRRNISKVYSMICVYLGVVQIASLAYLGVSTLVVNKEHNSDFDSRYIVSTKGALELSPKNNILVFVLDWYDEQILQKVIETEPDFLEPLDGFTHYSNVTSLYAFTEMSLPYLITGVEDGDSYDNGTMLEDISNAGYDTSVYTDLKYIPQQVWDILYNWQQTEYKPKYYVWNTISLMSMCSKYQMAPFVLKNIYWYTTNDFKLLERNDNFIKWETENDYPFLRALVNTGLSVYDVKDSIGSFKLYHMYGVHPAYNFTENCIPTNDTEDYNSMISQAKGSLKVVYEYINQLKALELYDSSTVVITADHGENDLYNPYRVDSRMKVLQLNKTSSPILLVKQSNSTWHGIHESKAPASHTELIASIVNAAGSERAADYGRTLEEISETERNVRTFIFTRDDMPYVKAEIDGEALNPDDWTIVEQIGIMD